MRREPQTVAQLALPLPDEFIDVVVARVVAVLTPEAAPDSEPWVGVREAAAHLACPASRVYDEVSRAKDPRNPNPLPYAKDGQRLLFRRSALDAWIAEGGHREREARR